MNVVGKALPFHMICDCGTKALPFTISRTDAASPGMAPGKSEVIWGSGTEPSQLLKSTIALQVVQPAKSRVRGRNEGNAYQGERLTGTNQARAHTSLPITSIFYCNPRPWPRALPSNDNPWLTSAATPNPELLVATGNCRAALGLGGRGRPSPHAPNPPCPTSPWQVA